MITPAMYSGLAGVQQGNSLLERSGDQIAKANIPAEQGGPDEIHSPLVDQIVGKHQVEVSAKVIQTANETIGSIIDIKV